MINSKERKLLEKINELQAMADAINGAEVDA